MKHDALVESLKAVREQLVAKDSAATAILMDSLVSLARSTPTPSADPRVVPLYENCLALAMQLTASLELELKSAARMARASSAYGTDP